MSKKYLVWDLPVRLFHWILVLTLSASWYCIENDLPEIHIQLGYLALGLIIFRIIWGIIGTHYAKFANFLPTPSKLIAYLRGESKESIGHNPMGSLMVLALLIFVAAQAISGLFIDDDVFSSGPYNGVFSAELEKVMSTIHHQGFDILLILVVLHVVAILFYKWRKKIDLITPMLTGKKSEEYMTEKEAIKHSKLLSAVILALAVAAFVYWLVVLNAPVIETYY